MTTPENNRAHEHMHGSEHGEQCGKCGKHHKKYAKLCPLSLAFAAGIVCALGMLVLGWMASNMHWGVEMVKLLDSVYKGFEPNLMGSIKGALWGFGDGFVTGLIFAWLYNLCSCRGCRSKKCHKCGSHCCKC